MGEGYKPAWAPVDGGVGVGGGAGRAVELPHEPSLMQDANTEAEYLAEIHDRIVRLGAILLGPQGTPPSDMKNPTVEAIPTLRRSLDKAASRIKMIEEALRYIETRL